MSQTQAPPAPTSAPAARPDETSDSVYVSPAPAQPIDWDTPAPAVDDAIAEVRREDRKARRRGLPAGPAMVAATNGMALAVTSAYQAAGWAGLAGSGALLVGTGAAGIAARRSTVRRRASGTGRGPAAARTSTGGRGYSGSASGSGGQRTAGTGQATRHTGPATRSTAGWDLGRPSGARAAGRAPGGYGHGAVGTSSVGSSGRATRSTAPGQPGNLPGHARKKPGHTGGAHSLLGRIADRIAGGTGRSKKDRDKGGKKRGKQTDGTAKSRRLAATAGRLGKRAAITTGRGTAALWKHTKPHRARARGAIWDGTVALTRGALTSLRRWSVRAGWDRLREVWAKRRQRRTENAAATTVTEPVTGQQPDVGNTVRRPATATTFSPSPTVNGGTMSGHHFTASAMEMARAAASYEPQGMLQVGQDFAGLQEALQLVAEAMRTTTEKADGEQPLDPRIIELMRGIYQLQQKAAEMAGELVPAFENLHHVDINRLRNPRNGEQMWDVKANQL